MSRDQFEREFQICQETGGCEYGVSCYHQRRCIVRHECRRSIRPVPFSVNLFDDDLTLASFDPDMLPTMATHRVVTVTMARPPAPNMRRSSRQVADQWIRIAGQEAINHAGVCRPSGCTCPNCAEYQRIRARATELFDKGYFTELSAAWHASLDEITGGAAETPWARPPMQPVERAAQRVTPLPAKIIRENNPEPEGSWVENRFGGLDL